MLRQAIHTRLDFDWARCHFGFPTGNAFALRSPWTEFDHSAIRLLSAVNASGELKTIPAGVEIRLSRGGKPIGVFRGRLAIP